MIPFMRCLLPLVAFAGLASGAAAQTPTAQVPLWNPAGFYVTVGQDEPGYRVWYAGAPSRGVEVKAFHDYLGTYGVAGIVPTWQLLRTASSWRRCGAQPFEVPPTTNWPHIVQTLRYLRDYVVPTVGPVEPVSAYRNPGLNSCAGGASDSAHRHFLAVDLVPLRSISRDVMMANLCAVHARQGNAYQTGLGFYAYMRFHIDSMKYRRWGGDGTPEASPCAEPLPQTAPPVAVTAVADTIAKGDPQARR
jgi:hypothetical protein